MIENKKSFSEKYDENAEFQIVKINRSISLYADDSEKERLHRRSMMRDKLLLCQPYALQKFSNIVEKHVVEALEQDEVYMFTIICETKDVGFDKIDEIRYGAIKKKIKEYLDGQNYIARICLDFRVDEYNGNDGMNVSVHIHGLFFDNLSKRTREKISKKIPRNNPKTRALVIKDFSDVKSAIQYAFKGPFGGKGRFNRKKPLTLKMYYQLFSKLQDTHLYDHFFAGGTGKAVLSEILKEAKPCD